MVCLSVSLSVTVMSPANTVNRSWCRLGWGLGWAQGTMYYIRSGPDRRMPREIFRGKGRPIVKYSDSLRWGVQKRQKRSRCHSGLGLGLAQGNVLGGGAHWRNLLNTISPSMCGGDAALCQITLTTCWVWSRFCFISGLNNNLLHVTFI